MPITLGADRPMAGDAPRVYLDDDCPEARLADAVLREDSPAVSEAISQGALVDFALPDFTGACPLALAAERGNIDLVELLLGSGADVNLGDEVDVTPLVYAVEAGHINVARTLMLHGADINALGMLGTALDVAVRKKNTELQAILRTAGALTKQELRRT